MPPPRERNARIAAVKQAQEEAPQLGEFIRLADYVCVSSCYLLTLSSCEKLLEAMTSLLQEAGATRPEQRRREHTQGWDFLRGMVGGSVPRDHTPPPADRPSLPAAGLGRAGP